MGKLTQGEIRTTWARCGMRNRVLSKFRRYWYCCTKDSKDKHAVIVLTSRQRACIHSIHASAGCKPACRMESEFSSYPCSITSTNVHRLVKVFHVALHKCCALGNFMDPSPSFAPRCSYFLLSLAALLPVHHGAWYSSGGSQGSRAYLKIDMW